MGKLKAAKSFTDELEKFYLRAWRQTSRAGCYYGRIAETIFKAAGNNPLLRDYARLLLASGPIFVDVMRDCYSYKKELQSLGVKAEVKGVKEVALDVLGLLDPPGGRGVWLYAFLSEYDRALVLRAMPRNPQAFVRKVCFKRILVRAKEGSLTIIPALNKAYRHRPKLEFKEIGPLSRLPHLELEQVALVRRGLVVPSLLVEAPAPAQGGQLIPSLGFIAAVSSVSFRRKCGKLVLKAGGQELLLDPSYALPSEGSSSILLILLRRRAVDGYYLGSVDCERASCALAFYVPRDLFIKVKGARAAEIISGMRRDLLRFCEPTGELKAEYETLQRRSASGRREALRAFYSMRGEDLFAIPNPSLAEYEEMPIWLMASLERSLSP
ncbi:MAG: hypothetical protein QW687_06025 [Candidatus Hadarchaeales archaeon]